MSIHIYINWNRKLEVKNYDMFILTNNRLLQLIFAYISKSTSFIRAIHVTLLTNQLHTSFWDKEFNCLKAR